MQVEALRDEYERIAVTVQLAPDEMAASLDAAGETQAAALIRAMAAELATVRAERDGLAAFTRGIAGLAGHGTSHNAGLSVRALETLDTLRVTERCPRRETGRHRWMRADPVFGSRCISCHARRPDDTPEGSRGNAGAVRP